MNKYFVFATYKSKYGLIVYCSKLPESVLPSDFAPDLSNLYLNTFYFKGREEIKVSEVYQFQTIKGENGLQYCFMV